MTAIAERTADASPRSRRGHRPQRPLFGVRLGQVVVWEAAALLLAAGLAYPGPARVPALAAAGLLLVATLPRLQRRPLYDWVLTRTRHATRRRGPRARDTGPLRALLPELSVGRAGGRSRVRMGVVHDGRAWIALVGVDRDDRIGPGQDTGAPIPVHRLGELLQVDDIAFDSVQVLVHSVSAPIVGDSAAEPCAASYRQLNSEGIPLTRSTWIALRLDEAVCPEAVAARGGGEAGIRRALRRGALQAVGLLHDEGRPAHVLDETEAAEALTAVAGLRGDEPGGQHPPSAEEWAAWHGQGVPHVSYWVRERNRNATGSGPARLQELLGGIPARAAVLSLTLTATSDGTPARTTLVRTTGAAPNEANALARSAAEHRIRLHRLDGEQAAGMLATLPLGRSVGPHVLAEPVTEPVAARAGGPLEPASPAEGLTLGTLRDGSPAPLRVFRRLPLRIGVFLPRPSVELLVFRLLGAGATVHVRSPQPQSWAALMRAAAVDPGRLVIGLPGGATPPAGGPLAPVVVVDDFPGGSGGPRADLGTWQTGLTLLPKVPDLPADGTAALRRYDAVLVPRLQPAAVRQLRAAYGLPDSVVRTLPLLPRDALAVVESGGAETVDLRPTQTENDLLHTLGHGPGVRP
ncbi:type VII secretion protein EccE [Streptomyces sp. NPDC002680]|uniref:type VII secretion protein EccE n=1 Tax=Streptomyces sp. NPDC002680 TaxID=3364659 RepID=UPI003681C38F